MKRAWVAVLAFAVVLAATQVAAPNLALADDVAVVDGATNYNSQRKVAVSKTGQVAVAYVARDGPATGVRVKVSDDRGRHWRELPQLSRAAAFRPAVAYDSAGVIHAVWTELAGEHRQVFAADWTSGSEWTSRFRLSDTPGYSGYPSIAVDSRDQLHVVWYGFDGQQYQIYYRWRGTKAIGSSGDVGPSWSPTVQASRVVKDANSPAIAVGTDDSIHVAYYSFVNGALDVQYMTGGPDGWTKPARVNPENVPSSQPSVAVYGDGTVALAYTAGEEDSTWVAYTERHGDGWTSPERISAPGSAAGAPSLAARSGHRGRRAPRALLVAYEELASGDTPGRGKPGADEADYRVVRTELGSDGAWSAGTVLSSGGARWPSVSWAMFPRQSADDPPGEGEYVAWTQSREADPVLGFAPIVTDSTGAEVRWSQLVTVLALLGVAGGALWWRRNRS